MTVDGAYVEFEDCDVICWKDAKIEVINGGVFGVTDGSHLYACGDMWDGIEAEDGTIIGIIEGSLIEDAEVAVSMEDGVWHVIDDAKFNRNYKHIVLTGPTASPTYAVQRIKSSQFLCQTTASIGSTPVHEDLLAPRETETTLIGIQAVNARGLLVGGSGDGNTFDNTAWFGVVTSGVPQVEVLYNNFTDANYCGTYVASSPGNGGETIDINYNTYDRSQYAIYCYDNDTTVRTHITYNTIDFDGMADPPDEMTGITVEEITAATEHNTANFLDISHDTILNAPCGIELMNLQGDLFTTDAALYVGENYITHTKVPNDGQAGIKTSYVTQGAFIDNEVTHPSGTVNWWETGIRLSNGSANAIICNNTHDVGRGIFFDGTQTPNTDVINNTMDNNQIGLFLNWSVIGVQGGKGNPRDNQWLGSTWSGSDPNTHVEGTSGLLSPFYVRNSIPSIYYPQYNTYNPTAPITINTTTGSWGGGCVYTDGASFKTDGAETEGQDDLLSIINMPEPQTDRERSLQWMGRYGLYKRLQADNGLMATAQELAAFYEAEDNANMGKLHRAVAGLKAARQGSVGVSTLSDLQTLQPANRVEQTLKDVLDILYANATDLTGMGAGDEARLREVAQLCPLDYGFGVYTARAALIKLDTLPMHYISECERVPSPEDISAKRSIEENIGYGFNAYPNPTNAGLTVNYVLEEGQNGRLTMMDFSGRIVKTTTLYTGQSTLELQLNGLAQGLYILHVDVEGQTKLSERITVIRP